MATYSDELTAIRTVTALQLAILAGDTTAADAIIGALDLDAARATVHELATVITRAWDRAAQDEAHLWLDEQAQAAGKAWRAAHPIGDWWLPS